MNNNNLLTNDLFIDRYSHQNNKDIKTVGAEKALFVGAGAFSNCDSLTDVYFGYDITRISHGAFENCKSLTDVWFAIIDEDKLIEENITELQNELTEVQNWIDNFDTSYAEQIIKDNIATMIFVEINSSGHIVYNIPSNWNDITFNTTGKDIEISGYDYGTLVLSY